MISVQRYLVDMYLQCCSVAVLQGVWCMDNINLNIHIYINHVMLCVFCCGISPHMLTSQAQMLLHLSHSPPDHMDLLYMFLLDDCTVPSYVHIGRPECHSQPRIHAPATFTFHTNSINSVCSYNYHSQQG